MIRTSPRSAPASRVAARSPGAWQRTGSKSLACCPDEGAGCASLTWLLAGSSQAPVFLSSAITSQYWGPVPRPPKIKGDHRVLEFQFMCSQGGHLKLGVRITTIQRVLVVFFSHLRLLRGSRRKCSNVSVTEGVSMHSTGARVSGSVFGLWAGERGQESALQSGAALSKAQVGKHREEQGSCVPLPDLRPGCRRPSCSLPRPAHPIQRLGMLGRPYFLNHDACCHIPHCLQKHH